MKRAIQVPVLLLLAGCQTVPMSQPGLPFHYEAKLEQTSTRCELNGAVIVWSHDDDIRGWCGDKAYGCVVAGKIMFVRHPHSWNDGQTLRTIGHEVMHLCGKGHEVVNQ